jgi:hypothetical protein
MQSFIGGGTILIIEDEQLMLRLVEKFLKLTRLWLRAVLIPR